MEAGIGEVRLFVLTHEYGDKSGFNVCGLTQSAAVAQAWFAANDENNVYEYGLDADVLPYTKSIQGWRVGIK